MKFEPDSTILLDGIPLKEKPKFFFSKICNFSPNFKSITWEIFQSWTTITQRDILSRNPGW